MRCTPCTRFIVIGILVLFVAVAQADFESEVIELVNAEREACNCGLHPLSYNIELTVAARRHSQDMGDRNYFDHATPDGTPDGIAFYERITDAGYIYQACGENIAAGYATPDGTTDGIAFYERITDAGYIYQACGENIAAGYATPEAVVDGWMNSDGHRANILDPDYCDIGVGYAAVDGSQYYHYWTQDFGRRAGVSQCPEPVAVPPATEAPVLSGSSDPGGGGGGGGCFIDASFTSGKLAVIVKNLLGSHD